MLYVLIAALIVFIAIVKYLSWRERWIDEALSEEVSKLAYWQAVLNDAKQEIASKRVLKIHRRTGLAKCNPNPRDPSSPQAKPREEPSQ